jgi:hypothetical protein
MVVIVLDDNAFFGAIFLRAFIMVLYRQPIAVFTIHVPSPFYVSETINRQETDSFIGQSGYSTDFLFNYLFIRNQSNIHTRTAIRNDFHKTARTIVSSIFAQSPPDPPPAGKGWQYLKLIRQRRRIIGSIEINSIPI